MAGYRQSFAPDRCAKRAAARIPAASSGEGPPALVAAAIGGGDGSDSHRCWDVEHDVHDIAQPANIKPGDQICRHLEHLRFDDVTCSVVVASVTLVRPAFGTSVPDNQQGLISIVRTMRARACRRPTSGVTAASRLSSVSTAPPRSCHSWPAAPGREYSLVADVAQGLSPATARIRGLKVAGAKQTFAS
jgi:hypothetical protein